MAEARVVMRAEVSNLVRGIRQANMSFDQLHDVIRNNWWGIQNVGVAFAAVGGAIAAGTVAATRAAADFESGMVGVARTTRQGSETAAEAVQNIGPLADELRELALIRPVPIERITAIAEEAGALGVAREDIRGFTMAILDMVSTTNLTDQSATQLARIAGVMDIPSGQFRNLGSAIMEVGTSVAATETEIVKFSTRLASSGRIAGFSAGELVAMSGAVLSLGSQAEAGASAMQRTLGSMAKAVVEGGDEIRVFARIAGKSVGEFAQIFREDGFEAVTLFVEGLARMGDDTSMVREALRGVGITEVRQVKALQELGTGIRNTSNEMLNLRNVAELGNQAFAEGTATTDAANEVNKTATARFELMKNAIKDMAIVWGSIFLPVVKFVSDGIANFAVGLSNLPTPIRYILTALTLLIGSLFGLASIGLLIIPRLVLVRGAFEALRTSILGASAASGGAAAPTAALAGAQTKLATAAGAAAAAEGRKSAADAVATRTAAASALTAARQAHAIGAVAGASALAIPGLMGYAGASATAAGASAGAGGAAAGAAGGAGILSRGFSKAGKALAKFKSPAVLATAATLGLIGYTIASGAEARKAAGETDDLGSQLDAMADEAADAQDELDGLNEEMEKGAEAAKKLNAAIQEQNQGIESLHDTYLDLKDSQQSLVEAQRELDAARADSASNADEIKRAEFELREAQFASADAARAIEEAELALSSARRNEMEKLASTERDLADARDRYRDASERAFEAQEALAQLQEGPSADELRDATNKLANAQNKLRDATTKVSDSQWYLNYLMEEGASARDIQDASYALEDAQQEVADSTDDVIDSQQEYNDLLEVTPEERAEAEREYAKAVRDVDDALQSIRDTERELGELRRRIAADTAHQEAEVALQRARIQGEQAIDNVAQAEMDLADARAGGEDADELARAELGYEQALYNVAKALADNEIAARRARGEHVSASEEARILAGYLRDVGATAEGPARKGLERYADALSNVRDEVETDVDDINGLLKKIGDIPPVDFGKLFDGIDDAKDDAKEGGEAAGKGIVESLMDWLEENAGELIVGALVTALVAAALPVGALAVVAAAIVGGIAAFLYSMLPEEWQKAIGSWVKGIPGWFKEKFEEIKGASAEQWISFAVGIVAGVPGQIFMSLWNNLRIGDWLKSIFSRDEEDSKKTGEKTGKSVAQKLWDGFMQFLKDFFNPASILRGIFNNSRQDAGNDSFSWGQFAADMMRNGLTGNLAGMGNALRSAFGHAWSGVSDWMRGPINAVAAMWNTLIEWIASMSFELPTVSVPSWVPGIGGKRWGGYVVDFGYLRQLRVPYMAQGGITRGPTLAMVGERGSEAIIPLDKLLASFEAIDLLAIQLTATNQSLQQLVQMSAAGAGVGGGDTFNLTALTDADAVDIADEFMWAKMIRSR